MVFAEQQQMFAFGWRALIAFRKTKFPGGHYQYRRLNARETRSLSHINAAFFSSFKRPTSVGLAMASKTPCTGQVSAQRKATPSGSALPRPKSFSIKSQVHPHAT